MTNIIINVSKYIILILMILYGVSAFIVLRKDDDRKKICVSTDRSCMSFSYIFLLI